MGNNGDGEEGLWRQSLLGQGDAFGALYDRHHNRVFRHAYRLCGNHHDAEDIMAASFLELWRRRRQVRVVEGSILPWLLVTATNMARNSARAALRYSRLLNALPRTEDLSDPAADPYRKYQNQLDQDLAAALGTLTAEGPALGDPGRFRGIDHRRCSRGPKFHACGSEITDAPRATAPECRPRR